MNTLTTLYTHVGKSLLVCNILKICFIRGITVHNLILQEMYTTYILRKTRPVQDIMSGVQHY
jgi:hypothetical protein